MTESTLPASENTLSTSALLVTSPPMSVKLSSVNGESAAAPPDPLGTLQLDGFLKVEVRYGS